MKTSKYNYIIEKGEVSYWYNGIEHTYFTLPLALGRKIRALMKSQDGLTLLPDVFSDKLLSGGFVLPDDTDELGIIRARNEERINQKDYLLILLPTLNCNFKCWYCIQDHIPSRMSLETMGAVKRHLDYMIDVEKITSLQIEWFGGEPFMYFKQIIEPLCDYAQNKCQQNDIPFITTATTNGFFLSPHIVSDIIRLNFKRFHITLDGPKMYHEKVKFQTHCDSSFEHVLTNVNNLLSNSDEIQTLLRINYTDDNLNLQIVDDVNDVILPENRQKVQVYLKKVWQEAVCKDRYNKVSSLLYRFEDSGYEVNRLDIIWDFVPCYANRKYYNTINYNGDVLKCTACNDLYDKNSHGTICLDGSISWDDKYIAKYKAKSFENQACLGCKYLPICMGVCPRDYGLSYCKFNGLDMQIEDALVNHIDAMGRTKK